VSASIHELLERSTFLEGLDRRDLAELAGRARMVAAGPGERVFAEGEPATALFLLVSGAVELSFGGPAGGRVGASPCRPSHPPGPPDRLVGDGGAGGDRLALGDRQAGDGAVLVGADVVLHLHRLQHHDGLPGLDRVAVGDQHLMVPCTGV
jgi:CRP-like cAMP-binding protein